MTNLWRCLWCDQETLSHLPLCIHCGPSSRGKMEPARTIGTPGRSSALILDAALRNLEMARDVTAIKLATLRPGSSAHKTTGGYLRGLVDSIQAIKAEMGADETRPNGRSAL